MSKYSTELKMQVVKAYLNNDGGYAYLADKYGVSDKPMIKKWVNAFKSQEYDGLTISRKIRITLSN